MYNKILISYSQVKKKKEKEKYKRNTRISSEKVDRIQMLASGTKRMKEKRTLVSSYTLLRGQRLLNFVLHVVQLRKLILHCNSSYQKSIHSDLFLYFYTFYTFTHTKLSNEL